MTDIQNKDLTELLTMAAESIVDFAALAVTAAQEVNKHVDERTKVTLKIWKTPTADDDGSVEKMSEKTYADDLHFVMSAIVGPIVCFFGMAGNLLSIITWSRPGMGSSTGRYLTGQALANFGVLLMFLLCDSIHYWSPAVKYSVIYGIFFCYFGYPIFYFTIILSIWFTVGVTVDRYVMVCWITKAKKLCSETRATVGLFLITVNSFIINLPHFASYTPAYPDDTNTTKTTQPKVAFVDTEFGAGEGGKFYEFWVHCIILILIPWVSVFFMNIMIIVKISEANKRMADKKTSESLKKSKESENQITRLLLAVTFTFLFFIGLQCIAQCLWMRKPPGANWLLVSASFAFGKTGILFNSSLNFLLYCMTGRRFRVELLKMFGLVKKDMLISSYMITSSSNISTSTTTSTTATGTKDM